MTSEKSLSTDKGHVKMQSESRLGIVLWNISVLFDLYASLTFGIVINTEVFKGHLGLHF